MPSCGLAVKGRRSDLAQPGARAEVNLSQEVKTCRPQLVGNGGPKGGHKRSLLGRGTQDRPPECRGQGPGGSLSRWAQRPQGWSRGFVNPPHSEPWKVLLTSPCSPVGTEWGFCSDPGEGDVA